MTPIDAAVMPFPDPETTPPVIKIYFGIVAVFATSLPSVYSSLAS